MNVDSNSTRIQYAKRYVGTSKKMYACYDESTEHFNSW